MDLIQQIERSEREEAAENVRLAEMEAQRIKNERLAKEENERLEKERLQKIEAQRLENERLRQEKIKQKQREDDAQKLREKEDNDRKIREAENAKQKKAAWQPTKTKAIGFLNNAARKAASERGKEAIDELNNAASVSGLSDSVKKEINTANRKVALAENEADFENAVEMIRRVIAELVTSK